MGAVISTPAESRRLILTREAAKVLDCGMSNLRWLAKTGKLKTWRLGPRSIAFDLREVIQYKAAMAETWRQAKREGRKPRGSEPKGFAPDT
jgi:hypothetical protein